jgi:transcriptional antiterminator RfaH
MNGEEEMGKQEEAVAETSVSSVRRSWYAVYTKSRAEKKVLHRLTEEGLEAFLPLQKTIRKWSDRRKVVDIPIISSYVFVRIRRREFAKVIRCTGVVKFITFEGAPVKIPEEQITNLKILSNSDADIVVTRDVFIKGDMVEVLYGSLAGLRGELVRTGNKRKVVMRIIDSDLNLTVDINTIAIKKLTRVKKGRKAAETSGDTGTQKP